ncbi:MAG TPA: DNA polymerase III subunit beta [Candidatus Fimenecus stercoravium]|nr:DNA polymerase III subunit beta [Candidatus Fimenecus stercoravium]
MKLICETQKLSEICSNVQRAVSTKSSIPAIEGILLEAGENVLTLTGYDLEVGMITSMEARVEEAGSIILNAKILCDILRSLPSDTVSIEADERLTCRIKSGDAEFTLIGIAAADYPELPSVESGFPIVLDSETLRDMIRKTIFATAENDVKVVHTGVRFEIGANQIRLVAVDGFRLAMRNEEIDYDGEEKIFVAPKKALNEVVKLTGGEETIALNVGKRFIVFEIGSYRIVSRLLEGEFLNYRAAISGKVTGTVRVNTRLLIQSIERTSLIITDRTKSPIRCVFDEDMIRISSTTALGTAHDRVPCKSEGEHMEIGFNNRYLLDALRVCDADEVLVKIGSPILPILIVPTEGEDFLFLVLPVRLKTE